MKTIAIIIKLFQPPSSSIATINKPQYLAKNYYFYLNNAQNLGAKPPR